MALALLIFPNINRTICELTLRLAVEKPMMPLAKMPSISIKCRASAVELSMVPLPYLCPSLVWEMPRPIAVLLPLLPLTDVLPFCGVCVFPSAMP